ncbi:hypothetical protein B0H11DRAFT_586645 [Mycena galericulata]|nr:hypothetical protein B0H11DRAFT_586645 [Mycena galericulata]
MASKFSSADLTPLGKYAFIQRPTSVSSTSLTDPTVVLIFGWMSARLLHLLKYTSMYRQIYPDATIIVVRSNISILWTSHATRFKPVVEVLEALGCLQNRQRILTHSFSNGGAFHLIALQGILSSKNTNTQTPRTASAMIIDSAPGGDSLAKLQLALTSPIKNAFLRLLASFFIRVVYSILWTRGQILRRPSPLQTMMVSLRRPRVLPWIDERTPRLYIYSKVDEMVPFTDVEAHAARSESEGLDVRRVCFDKSPHVAHARLYPEEFWTAVRKVWTDGCTVQN